VSVTTVPFENDALQVLEGDPAVSVQLIPAGELVIVPTPAPDPVMVSVQFAAATVTLVLALLLPVNPPSPLSVVETAVLNQNWVAGEFAAMVTLETGAAQVELA
jgi:hypothetical protein